jgi:hypothetical protein
MGLELSADLRVFLVGVAMVGVGHFQQQHGGRDTLGALDVAFLVLGRIECLGQAF